MPYTYNSVFCLCVDAMTAFSGVTFVGFASFSSLCFIETTVFRSMVFDMQTPR